jgi:hypothetical protein
MLLVRRKMGMGLLLNKLNNGSSNARPSGHGVTNMHVRPLLASYDDAHDDDSGGGSTRNASRSVTPLTEEIFKNRSQISIGSSRTLGLTKITIKFRPRSDVRYARSLLWIDSGSRSGILFGRACSPSPRQGFVTR